MSIVNLNFSFSVTATINDQAVVFMVDAGSAVTILRRDTWERCKKPEQQLVPWCQSRLVGAEESHLWVCGSAPIVLSVEGNKFELSEEVIDPLTSEAILGLDMLTTCTVDLSHKRLITGAGHVIGLDCQRQNNKDTVCVNDGQHQHDSCVVLPSSKPADTLIAMDTVEKFAKNWSYIIS